MNKTYGIIYRDVLYIDTIWVWGRYQDTGYCWGVTGIPKSLPRGGFFGGGGVKSQLHVGSNREIPSHLQYSISCVDTVVGSLIVRLCKPKFENQGMVYTVVDRGTLLYTDNVRISGYYYG